MAKKAITAKIEESVVERIKRMCEEENRSFSNMLDVILIEWAKEKAA